MFSWASSRKPSRSIHRVLSSVQRVSSRPLFNKSQPSSSSSSSPSSSSSSSVSSSVGGFGYNEYNNSGSFNFFLRSISSGVLIIGSSLGFSYWSSSSLDPNPFNLSFADNCPKETTTWAMTNDPNKAPSSLFPDAYRKRKFFKYEKRLREQSPPEKVFEYFASVKQDGEAYMSPADLMRAVVPVFPPSESTRVREGCLRGEQVPGHLQCAPSKFFMLFDTDGDGLISFAEFIFFLTLLRIPESSFRVAFKMFDHDNSGDIDKEEFNKVMAVMRSQSKQSKDGHRIKVSVEGGLLDYFFGKDGKASLKVERFVQFFRDLHDEILRLEFSHYDYKSQGSISAKDFALSLVASADISDINKLLDRVDEIDDSNLKDIHITFKEFKDFAELRKNLQSFSIAIFSYGEVNGVLRKQDFQRAASQVSGISVTNNVIDIIFHVFDADGDGDLSANEFVRALKNRGGEISQTGLRGLLSCWFNCTFRRQSCNFNF